MRMRGGFPVLTIMGNQHAKSSKKRSKRTFASSTSSPMKLYASVDQMKRSVSAYPETLRPATTDDIDMIHKSSFVDAESLHLSSSSSSPSEDSTEKTQPKMNGLFNKASKANEEEISPTIDEQPPPQRTNLPACRTYSTGGPPDAVPLSSKPSTGSGDGRREFTCNSLPKKKSSSSMQLGDMILSKNLPGIQPLCIPSTSSMSYSSTPRPAASGSAPRSPAIVTSPVKCSRIQHFGFPAPNASRSTNLQLSAAQISLVRKTWAHARSQGSTEPGLSIFRNSFFKNPDVRTLVMQGAKDIGHDRLKKHARDFTDAMDKIIANLEFVDPHIAELKEYGAAHAILPKEQCNCPFRASHLDDFASAMVERTLEWGEKKDRTEVSQTAWTKIVLFVVEQLKDGYLEAMRKERRAKQKQVLNILWTAPTCRQMQPQPATAWMASSTGGGIAHSSLVEANSPPSIPRQPPGAIPRDLIRRVNTVDNL